MKINLIHNNLNDGNGGQKATPPSCEFCSEFSNPIDSRFGKIYGSAVSRTVFKENGFVVLPTIGQLFEGSMLVLPDEHIERIADLDETRMDQCLQIVEAISRRVSSLGNPIIFEHGARATTGGGCGIFHAHFHIVPSPLKEKSASMRDLMPSCDQAISASSLKDALQRLKSIDEYLLLRDTEGQVVFLEVTSEIKPSIPSQYFRQSLVSHYKLSIPWDWRAYGFEKRLLSTINHFRSSAA